MRIPNKSKGDDFEKFCLSCGHIAVYFGTPEEKQRMRRLLANTKCGTCIGKEQKTCWVIYFPDLKQWKGPNGFVDSYREAMQFTSNRLAANYAYNYSQMSLHVGTRNYRIQYREKF